MKKLLYLILLISGFAYSQMPNISKVWLNHNSPYTGTIGSDKKTISVRIESAEQNKKNDQEYFVKGYSTVNNGNETKFEGKITIKKYRDSRRRSALYGEYEWVEASTGKHSGTLSGKFIYTFKWNEETRNIESPLIEFVGKWKSFDNAENYNTIWKSE